MDLTLVVLAAGLGSRYGGLKQLDPVGPSGEIILNYSLYDARMAGFNRTVFIIRQETEPAFRERFDPSVRYAYQTARPLATPKLGEGGTDRPGKPWGTGHAVFCARDLVNEPFAVINADDFYGANAFRALAGFLRGARATQYAMVGYRLDNTLSEHGLVSRGICELDEKSQLRSIVEQKGIAKSEVGPGGKFTGAETVSMNCWGFTTAVFAPLEKEFRAFQAEHREDSAAEFYLPSAISAMIARGQATVDVLPTGDSWFGVTYREDRPRVQASIAELIASGKYPKKL